MTVITKRYTLTYNSHVAKVLWYFGFAWYQSSTDSLADSLSNYFEDESLSEGEDDETQRSRELSYCHIFLYAHIFYNFPITFQVNAYLCFPDFMERTL